MAKGPIMFSKASGKLGNMVLSVNKGQQIAREYVAKPANPRTNQQMGQRIPFAACALFYKRATQAFFKFAFEGKKATESDYNAFMRVNMRETEPIHPYKEEAQNPNFPLVNDWVMTQGSFASVTGDFFGNICRSKIEVPSPDATDWEHFLTQNPDFQMGDIITFCHIRTDATFDIASGRITPGTTPPIYTIKQIIVGADLRGGSLADYIDANGLTCDTIQTGTDGIVYDSDWSDIPSAFVFVHSRPSKSGLKVSTEKLLGNYFANTLFEVLFDQSETALPSWQATGEAILQGNVAENANVISGTYDSYKGKITNSLLQYPMVDGFSTGLKKGDRLNMAVELAGVSHDIELTVGGKLVQETYTINNKATRFQFKGSTSSLSGGGEVSVSCLDDIPVSGGVTVNVGGVTGTIYLNGVAQTPNA
ncbi:MAG: DUF6266 family protein [Paludibacteraceae bacterium]|nr:DUF6266 family protein [Paludibacteraceae bacterium]